MGLPGKIALLAAVSLMTFGAGVGLSKIRHQARQSPPTPWETLLTFEDKDIANLNDDAARTLKQAIDSLTGPTGSEAFPFEPKLFRKMANAKGERHYVLVEQRQLFMIPGESRLRIHVFNSDGTLLSGRNFSAGWRTVLTGITVRTNHVLNRELLVVNGEYCLGGSPSSQYYTLVDDKIMLTYLETVGGFDPNVYVTSHETIGTLTPQRSVDEWEAALNSDDMAEVTSTLIWLGGVHWDGQPSPYDEDKPEAEKVSTLLARDSVKKRLNELRNSNDRWVWVTANHVIDRNFEYSFWKESQRLKRADKVQSRSGNQPSELTSLTLCELATNGMGYIGKDVVIGASYVSRLSSERFKILTKCGTDNWVSAVVTPSSKLPTNLFERLNRLRFARDYSMQSATEKVIIRGVVQIGRIHDFDIDATQVEVIGSFSN